MNAIVAGKQEKVAGTMVFKVQETYNFTSYTNSQLISNVSTDYINNSYLRITTADARIYMFPIFRLCSNESPKFYKASFVMGSVSDYRTFSVSRIYDTINIACEGGNLSWSYFVPKAEIGTLEIT